MASTGTKVLIGLQAVTLPLAIVGAMTLRDHWPFLVTAKYHNSQMAEKDATIAAKQVIIDDAINALPALLTAEFQRGQDSISHYDSGREVVIDKDGIAMPVTHYLDEYAAGRDRLLRICDDHSQVELENFVDMIAWGSDEDLQDRVDANERRILYIPKDGFGLDRKTIEGIRKLSEKIEAQVIDPTSAFNQAGNGNIIYSYAKVTTPPSTPASGTRPGQQALVLRQKLGGVTTELGRLSL
ncbi:hypothetical protein N9Z27_02925 [Alphaproteobacteria bacterium]|nr:hypothetical protein [Alphaproteobacteria bacterium]